jgi:hypothetical protein
LFAVTGFGYFKFLFLCQCLWACHFLWPWICFYCLKSVLRALKVSVV